MSSLPDDWRAFGRRLFGEDSATLRMMQPRDLEEVLRIIRLHDSDDYHAARESFEASGWNEPNYAPDPERGAHFVLVDPDEQRVVGVSGYYIDDLESKGIYWLGWMYVNPFFQGNGYGTQLLRYVVRVVRKLDARKLYVSTSGSENYRGARRFYERHGFVKEGHLHDYYREGEDKLIYGRRL